jgi:hypothetical protein
MFKPSAFLMVVLLLVSSQSAWSAGIALYETGATDLGTGKRRACRDGRRRFDGGSEPDRDNAR